MSLKDIKNRFLPESETLEIRNKKYTFKWDSLNEVYEVVERTKDGPPFFPRHESNGLTGITFMSKQAFERFRMELS